MLSLQLLNRLCDMQNGHKQVSDAISMLRLRFGEPVRFKFLVGMLNSHNASGFQVSVGPILPKPGIVNLNSSQESVRLLHENRQGMEFQAFGNWN